MNGYITYEEGLLSAWKDAIETLKNRIKDDYTSYYFIYDTTDDVCYLVESKNVEELLESLHDNHGLWERDIDKIFEDFICYKVISEDYYKNYPKLQENCKKIRGTELVRKKSELYAEVTVTFGVN